MKLRFSGAPEMATTRDHVWQRLLDPHFVARSAPGVESVQPLDANRFKVVSGFGVEVPALPALHDPQPPGLIRTLPTSVLPGAAAGHRNHVDPPGRLVDAQRYVGSAGRRPAGARWQIPDGVR